MNKLTIKETIDNMIDELSRTSDVIQSIRSGNVNEIDICLDELYDDINNTLLNELSFFKERIDLALLMSAAVSDIAIPTCGEIYKVEADYDLPIEDGIIDTETVYNTVEEVTKDVLKNVYGEDVDNTTYTVHLYEEDKLAIAYLSTYDDKEEAIHFAAERGWDEVVNDKTGEVIWRNNYKGEV